ncbi:MarR family winged helix-turn-helix transcriptional regulator [Pseudoduganella violaceinigra]|uniref:MarR family winged helix-turn-helix transcriptional regulator n=1 Tax=Pseudoduganella violaceinigra TaxID=246602 RepID=UPI000687D654|nr:MarR family transcriptional regulator [Pseudoduganella violaceinigra]
MPAMDVGPMGVIGRLNRCAALVRRRLDAKFEEFGLSNWEFDVLATLRRAGAPHQLAPTALFSQLMVTSGTMTHRLHRLEQQGWVTRTTNPADARSLLVQLSPAGLALIERAVQAHVDNEKNIMAPLGADGTAALDAQLRQLLAMLEP